MAIPEIKPNGHLTVCSPIISFVQLRGVPVCAIPFAAVLRHPLSKISLKVPIHQCKREHLCSRKYPLLSPLSHKPTNSTFFFSPERRDVIKVSHISQEVAEALAENKPVVALESTIISHGMPYPQNVETALKVEQVIRDNGAVPATIAIIGGKLKAGLTKAEIEHLGKTGSAVTKVSRRDLPIIVAKGMDGATTVATTMIIASLAGIKVFATGGVGGVHRGAETTMDISADLEELAMTPVMVICAGAKSILDLGLTLEYLETKGVPVIGYGTDELPAFYTRKSGFGVDYQLNTPKELAEAFLVKQAVGLKGGMLVTNPIPGEYSMDSEVINKAIDEAIAESKRQGIHGKDTTPFLLAKVKEITGGDSLDSNIQLVFNNARLAAQTAAELCKIK